MNNFADFQKVRNHLRLIGEKNQEIKKHLEFCRKTFVGHRFGTNFFDMVIIFEKSNKKSLKRNLDHEDNDMETEAKRKKRKTG